MAIYALTHTEKGIASLSAKEIAPCAFKAITSPLAAAILDELSKNPTYPKALAKKLRVHEQRIYYHIRKMQKAGFIKVVNRVEIGGAVALYYALHEPAFLLRTKPFESAAKLIAQPSNDFLFPFIDGGMLNALIIVGSPDPHGPERARSRDGYYGMDLALFLGTFLSHVQSQHVKLDTEIRVEELPRHNLILIGGPIVNKTMEKVNEKLPIYFDKSQRWAVYSKISGESYPSDETGLIVKTKSPFNKEKYVLVVAGKRHAGTRAAILSFLQYSDELAKGNKHNPKFCAKVIEGIDKDGDGLIDAIEVKE